MTLFEYFMTKVGYFTNHLGEKISTIAIKKMTDDLYYYNHNGTTVTLNAYGVNDKDSKLSLNKFYEVHPPISLDN